MIRPAYTFLAVAAFTLLFLGIIIGSWEQPGEPLNASSSKNADLLELTGTTARLAGEDHSQTAVAYSQTIYAHAQDKDRPGALILVRDDDVASAIATTRLQHFPINAPLLYLTNEGRTIPEATREEMKRLEPEGVMMDNNVQVYVAGNISEDIARQVEEEFDLRVRRIYGADPITYNEVLDEYLAVLESNHRDVILVGSTAALEYALPAANWNSHMGQGFAFVTPEGVPDSTRRIMERSWPDYPYIYVFAPPDVVNESVMEDLAKYGHVQRIPGDTPGEMAVRWAGYKDSGLRVDWWISFRSRSVGWGYAEPGHNILVGDPADWRTVVPSGVLSHMGKHAFLILTEPGGGQLPPAAVSYLKVLKPTPTYPNQQVYNYGWILGTPVSDATMRNVSELLSIRSPEALSTISDILPAGEGSPVSFSISAGRASGH